MKRRSFLVIGAGRFGSALATTLYDMGHEVVAVDELEDAIADVMDRVTHGAIADATDEAALRKLGLNTFDAVIVAIGGNFEASVLATVAAKTSGARRVISKANTELAARVLASVGANEVIRPEHDMGVRLARQLVTPSFIDAFALGSDYGVVELELGEKLNGRLGDLDLPRRFGVQVIAAYRAGQLHVGPGADFRLEPGDRAVVIGSNEAVARLRDYLS